MNTKLKQHGPYNPYKGQDFKIITYNSKDEPIDSEEVEISSQEEFLTILGSIKQFNATYASLNDMGLRKYKKLLNSIQS